MNTQLTLIRKLIAEDLHPEAPAMEVSEMQQWIKALPRIRENILIALRSEVFGEVSDRLLERHIQQMQSECVELLDLLYGYVPHLDSALFTAAEVTLTHLLSYLEKHHNTYFNLEAHTPQRYFKTSIAEIGVRFSALKSQLKQLMLDDALAGIIFNVIAEFAQKPGCSYAELIHFKGLIQSLLGLCEQRDGIIVPKEERKQIFTAVVEEHLFYYRFDHPLFINYVLDKLLTAIADCFDVREKVEILLDFEKRLKAQQERSGWGGSARSILLNYIKAQLMCLQEKRKLYEEPATTRKQGRGIPEYKIKARLSVEALAYLVRLLVDAGAINGSPRRPLLGFVAHSVETPRSGPGDISIDSLHNKYKQVTQRTADGVRALLKKMLKLLEADFG